jgi:ribosomal protein S19
VNEKIQSKVEAMLKSGDKKVLKLWDRAAQITPELM